MTYRTLKNAIADYEYYNTGLHRICGTGVKVKKISIDTPRSIDEDEEIMIHAVVTIYEDDKHTTYDDCEYKLSEIVKRATKTK